MIRLGSNISSLHAQRKLSEHTDALSKTFERLSSGQRINSAADDSAGLAISSGLNASQRVFTTAIRNGNDGLSALSIADGALQSLTSIVTRQKELAEQAANGTYSTNQRKSLNTEAEALTREFNRIVEATTFNGLNLLSGTFRDTRLQLGYGLDGSISIGVGSEIDRNIWDGAFSGNTGFAVGNTVREVITGDLDGDGNQDLVYSDVGTGRWQITWGNGDGTFTAPLSLPGNSNPREMKMADLNGDGRLDLINISSGGFAQVYSNQGNRSFSEIGNTSFGVDAWSLTVGDFNADGIQDISVAQFDGASIFVALGNGNGTFRTPTSFTATNISQGLESIDYNNDGKLDLVAVGSNFISVHYGNGNGTFTAARTLASFSGTASEARIADFDRDGIFDIAITDTSGGQGLRIFLGNSDGSLESPLNFLSGISGQDIEVLDFNGDGIEDIIVSGGASQNNYILQSNGDGTFKSTVTLGVGASAAYLAIADFNKDGVYDIATSHSNSNFNLRISSARTTTSSAFLNLLTQQGAKAALESTSLSLEQLGLERGKIGAYQSRLGVAINQLGVSREQYAAAESRIVDVDIAEESATLVLKTIQQQAASAILAQVNIQPQIALKLLIN